MNCKVQNVAASFLASVKGAGCSHSYDDLQQFPVLNL